MNATISRVIRAVKIILYSLYTSLIVILKTKAIFLSLNIQSLGFHYAELVVFLETLEKKPDVIALTETWLKDSDQLEDYDLPGYQTIVSKSRNNARRRSGGVNFVLEIIFNIQYRILTHNLIA